MSRPLATALALLVFAPAAFAQQASTPPPPPPAPAADAPLRASEPKQTTIFVKDLDHLAELVRTDAVVGPMAQSLARRQTTSQITMYSSLAAGLAVAAVGLFVLPKSHCSFGLQGSQSCTYGATNYAVAGGGLGLSLAGVLAGWAIGPKRDDLLDVLNAWNQRHPDEPFQISPTR